MNGASASKEKTVHIEVNAVRLEGALALPVGAQGVVLFAHGSGSSRHSPRNRKVAAGLQQVGLATLLIDLLSAREEDAERLTGHLRFDIPLLAERLIIATDWLVRQPATDKLKVGYFGSSTGAAAALMAAGERPEVAAVVSRGGRPDMAGPALARLSTPTLLIVGGDDLGVIDLNRHALAQMPAGAELEVVPGAGHLFEETGALARVTALACDWFLRYLVKSPQA